MKILVTGGAGFLGSELVFELAKSKANEIYVFDSLAYGTPSKFPKRKNIKDLIVGNIKDYYAISRTIEKVRPDIIFHLASHITRPETLGEFRVCSEVNYLGTANLLDACFREKYLPKRIIFASTEAVHNPTSHHGISTLAAEGLIKSVCPVAGIKLSILRFSEIYGLSRSQTSKSLINFLVDNMVVSQDVAVFDVNKQKDYVHISDAVRACKLAISDTSSDNYTIDIGTGDGIATKVLVEKLKDISGFTGQMKYLEHPGVRVVDSISDPSPAKILLGFDCEADFDTELKKLIVKRRKDLK